MPRGYQTPLGEAPMSGGETQRIGLARTFAHAGRLLVFDDVASSLDTVTEHQISEVLTGAFGARTRIVIAHRASTAARMDFVVWLERGTVRAKAPHQGLWQDPDYRALFGPEDRSPGLRVARDGETAG
jgi:ATP-binding cassette subfamily B protein